MFSLCSNVSFFAYLCECFMHTREDCVCSVLLRYSIQFIISKTFTYVVQFLYIFTFLVVHWTSIILGVEVSISSVFLYFSLPFLVFVYGGGYCVICCTDNHTC